MGQITDMQIAAWQKRTGIKPAHGEIAVALEEMSQAAFALIKLIELERSGIRDGDGFWYGSDMIGHMPDDIVSAHRRLMAAYEIF